MNSRFKKFIWPGVFILAGLAGGFLYWKFIGCNSGSCAITSSWHYSMLFGGLVGYLLGDSVNDYKKKKLNS